MKRLAIAFVTSVFLLGGLAAVPAQARSTSWDIQGNFTAEAQRTKVYRLCGYRKPVARPHRVLLACGDGNGSYTHLRWQKWERRHAVAFGDLTLNDCIPFCARGTLHDYSVRIHAFRVRKIGGHRVFTRSAYVFLGRKAPNMPRRGRIALPSFPLSRP